FHFYSIVIVEMLNKWGNTRYEPLQSNTFAFFRDIWLDRGHLRRAHGGSRVLRFPRGPRAYFSRWLVEFICMGSLLQSVSNIRIDLDKAPFLDSDRRFGRTKRRHVAI